MILPGMTSAARSHLSLGQPLTMSRSLARVVATPSYGETQLPDVDLHALSVTTFVPSRFSTVSRVSHVPETYGNGEHASGDAMTSVIVLMSQVLNRSRE